MLMTYIIVAAIIHGLYVIWVLNMSEVDEQLKPFLERFQRDKMFGFLLFLPIYAKALGLV